MIAPQSLEQLLNAAVIEDVVGDYVTLKRAGARFKGLCPFHDEKTPSFTVTPSLGIYKCFGCQKGGNAINFVMEMENQTYAEAARTLAKRYGIELIETGGRDDEAYRETQKLRENIQVVLDFAQQFFVQNLNDTEEGKTIAASYFSERGFTRETIIRWGLGYSPSEWEALTHKAQAGGYTMETMEQAGLVRKRDNGSFYDLFRNRVIFPIHSVSGKVIAFAGRKMSSTDPAPKYVNSPETELYKKSEILYGIFQAKNAIKKEDKVYLTEGYTDVITLAQYGVENVVASSGTALTPGQIKLLRRFTPNVTVVYDGDKAGIKASLRGINLLLAEDLNVRVVELPEGEDPDSWCKKLGSEGFAAYLQEHEKNFIFFKAGLLLETAGTDPIRRTEAVRDILESVAEIADPLKRNSMNRELSRICDMDESLLATELAKLVMRKSGKGPSPVADQPREQQPQVIQLPQADLRDDHQEEALVRLILLHGHQPFNEVHTVFQYALQELENDEFLEFGNELYSRLIQEFRSFHQTGWPGTSHFTNHQSPEIASWAAGVLSSGYNLSPAYAEHFIYVTEDKDNFRHELVSIFVHLRRKKLDKLIQQRKEMLKDSPEQADEIFMEIMYYESLKSRNSTEFGYADYKP